MNEHQWERMTSWADHVAKERSQFTTQVINERRRGQLTKEQAVTLLRRAGYHQDQIDSIL